MFTLELFPDGEPDQAWNDTYTDMFFYEYLIIKNTKDINKIIDFYIHCAEISLVRLAKQPPAHPWDFDPFSFYCTDPFFLNIKHKDISYLAAQVFHICNAFRYDKGLLFAMLECFQLIKQGEYKGYNDNAKEFIRKTIKENYNKHIFKEFFGELNLSIKSTVYNYRR